MEKLGIFIPKLHHSLSKPLLPVGILHGKQISNVSFDDLSESSFLGLQVSKFFKLIKESNSEITV
jgi:hypothetical protein